ncbi:MAG: hypothetical protein SNJ77_03405 [Cytophagales bacterium]
MVVSFLILVGQFAHCQYLSLEQKNIDPCPFDKIDFVQIVDSRYDTTRAGLIEIESLKRMVDFKKGLKNEFSAFIKNTCNTSELFGDTLVMNVIRFKISDNGSLSKDIYSIDYKFEFLIKRKQEMLLVNLMIDKKNFQKLKKGKTDYEQSIAIVLRDALSEISSILSHGQKKLTITNDLSKPILKSAPILTTAMPKKGIYLSFKDFVNNEPNIEERFDVIYDNEKKEARLAKKDGKFYYYNEENQIIYITTQVWGFCDGKDFYKKENFGFSKLINNNGVIEYWGLNHRNKASYYILDVQTGESILF